MAKIPDVDAASLAEIAAARMRVAMQSPGHMKLWLQESGRRYMVFDGMDLVDSMWIGNNPVMVQEFQGWLAVYRGYRQKIPTGNTETTEDPMTGQPVEFPLFKDEGLEPEEMDRAIRYLIVEMQKKNPAWSLEDPAL